MILLEQVHNDASISHGVMDMLEVTLVMRRGINLNFCNFDVLGN